MVLETHAGAGLYDVRGQMARRSGEAQKGAGRLLEARDPPVWLERLRARICALNPAGGLGLYPGSPLLAAERLRPLDHMRLFELRAEDAAALRATLAARAPAAAPRIEVRTADGYAGALEGRGLAFSALCLVDPPFETGRDVEEICRFVERRRLAFPGSPVAIWAPLKDLESYDALLRGLERLAPPDLVSAEARLRPLADPLRMNGCGLILLDAALPLAPLEEVCRWIVDACGDAGGRALVRRL
jgi:23S rRNA (adenine2030-N6)-methyltransferase